MLSPSQLDLGDVRASAVAVVNTAGVQLSGFDQSRPATAALTSVAGSATSVSLLAANAARRQVFIDNDSTKTLYVAFAATATIAAFTLRIASGQSWESELNGYTGAISGIWTSANGNARITEVTT